MRLATSISAVAVALFLVACGDKDKGKEANYDQGKNDRAEELDKLLRGEISAVETYNQAINRYGSEPGGEDLKKIRADHQASVDTLRAMVSAAGGKPSTSSGVWGNFAKAIEGTAKLIGNDAAFKVLKEGEEKGVSDYESALKDEDLTPADKEQLRKLQSKTQEHRTQLDALRARTD